jgi:hypothetical protein
MSFYNSGNSVTAARAFSLIEVEADLEEQIKRHPLPEHLRRHDHLNYAPPAVRTDPLPGYVEHGPNVSDVGKLSAEAVVKQYEVAARAVEAMGAELTASLEKLDATKLETMAALKELNEVVEAYRETGKRIFLQIENHSLMTTEVRSTCAALKEKIAGTPT